MEDQRAKTATSAGSYLDQPFVLWKESCTHVLYICPPYVGLQWVGCTFPRSARCLSPGNIPEWSDNSVYNETEREDIDSDTSDSILKDYSLQKCILKKHHITQKFHNEVTLRKLFKLLSGWVTEFGPFSFLDAFAQAFKLPRLAPNVSRRTQVLHQPPKHGTASPPGIHTDNTSPENVDPYFGSFLSSRADADKEIRHHISCASASESSCSFHSTVWNTQHSNSLGFSQWLNCHITVDLLDRSCHSSAGMAVCPTTGSLLRTLRETMKCRPNWQTHMTANRPWSCWLLLWLETGLN